MDAGNWAVRAHEILTKCPCTKCIADLAAEAYQAGLKQRIEEIELVKDDVCLVCGTDQAAGYDKGHAAGVAEERAQWEDRERRDRFKVSK